MYVYVYMYVYIYIYICIYVYIYIYNEEKTPMFSNFAKISSKYADQVQTNRGKLVWCKQKTIFLVSYSHPNVLVQRSVFRSRGIFVLLLMCSKISCLL